jgi:hypothetical protein
VSFFHLLDFIAWLEARYGVSAPAVPAPSASSTEDFIARHAGALGDDFPDDIDDSDLGEDGARDSLEGSAICWIPTPALP